jgi:nitroimidazol reductase NimA-like FMN-containing flavoprotein (pyridoxamine 5'-phosphate oxidase superfamily)
MLTDRTRLHRRAARGSHETALVFEILDAALHCHVGFVAEGQPYVIPTMHARIGENLYFHGAPANRMLGVLREGFPCCVTATLIDGFVLGRTAFHHSMNYRSVVVLGTARPVTSREESTAALRALIERVQPGRWEACRQPSESELAATSVVRLPVTEASAKVRSGPPLDAGEDLDLPHWAGVIPLRMIAGDPQPDSHVPAGNAFPHAKISVWG